MKSKLSLLVLATTSVVVGVLIGRWGLGPGADSRPGDPDAAVVSQTELEELETELTELAVRERQLNLENEELTRENAELEQRIATLDEALIALRADPAPEPRDPAPGEGRLPLAFGRYADLEVLLGADWETMAAAMDTMGRDLAALFESLGRGEEPDLDTVVRIQKENAKLLQFALEANGKLPTHATGNGEFTHPIATVNLMSQLLDDRDQPLTEDQRLSIARFGEEFESEWERVNERYPASAPAIEKLLDEIDLKREFMGQVSGALSETQLSAVFHEGTRDVAGLDLFSPGLIFTSYAKPVPVTDAKDLRRKLLTETSQFFGLAVDELEAHPEIFDGWAAKLQSTLKPIHASRLQHFPVDDGLVAGRAQLAAMQAIAASFPLTEEQRAKIHDTRGLLVPRLLESP